MSCYSIRPTTTSALPRLLPDPLLDRIDAIQRADPWAHEDAVDEGGLDGYADSPPLGGAAARLGFAPPHLAFDEAATPPWPPHAASLARLEQSGLQPSPRVLPGADQVRTPYTQTFRIGPRTILGADTPITIVNRFCLDHGLALWELGGIRAEQQRWELYRLLRKVQWPETADEYAEVERLGTRGALGSLLARRGSPSLARRPHRRRYDGEAAAGAHARGPTAGGPGAPRALPRDGRRGRAAAAAAQRANTPRGPRPPPRAAAAAAAVGVAAAAAARPPAQAEADGAAAEGATEGRHGERGSATARPALDSTPAPAEAPRPQRGGSAPRRAEAQAAAPAAAAAAPAPSLSAGTPARLRPPCRRLGYAGQAAEGQLDDVTERAEGRAERGGVGGGAGRAEESARAEQRKNGTMRDARSEPRSGAGVIRPLAEACCARSHHQLQEERRGVRAAARPPPDPRHERPLPLLLRDPLRDHAGAPAQDDRREDLEADQDAAVEAVRAAVKRVGDARVSRLTPPRHSHSATTQRSLCSGRRRPRRGSP